MDFLDPISENTSVPSSFLQQYLPTQGSRLNSGECCQWLTRWRFNCSCPGALSSGWNHRLEAGFWGDATMEQQDAWDRVFQKLQRIFQIQFKSGDSLDRQKIQKAAHNNLHYTENNRNTRSLPRTSWVGKQLSNQDDISSCLLVLNTLPMEAPSRVTLPGPLSTT